MTDGDHHDAGAKPRDGGSSAGSDLTTQRLLNRARQGDRDALERLFRRYEGPIRRWARGRLPRSARGALDTADVVQEVFLGALRNVDAFEPRHRGAFQGYLRRGVANRIRDEVRRNVPAPRQVETAGRLVDRGASPVERLVGKELLERYEAALTALRSEDQDAVFARVELQLAYADVADYLGKPSADAARMAVRRALLRLARAMADEE